MIVRSADIQFMLIQLERIIQRRVTSRVIAFTCLITRVVTQGIACRICQQVRTVVRVGHAEYLRITHHTKTRNTYRMSFGYMEIKASATKHTASSM